MLNIQIVDGLYCDDNGFLHFPSGTIKRLPTTLQGLFTYQGKHIYAQDLVKIGFKPGMSDKLLEIGLIQLYHDNNVLPAHPRLYLAEQLPQAVLQWPLEQWLETKTKSMPLWIGVPYESPRELIGSTSIGCAKIIKAGRKEKQELQRFQRL